MSYDSRSEIPTPMGSGFPLDRTSRHSCAALRILQGLFLRILIPAEVEEELNFKYRGTESNFIDTHKLNNLIFGRKVSEVQKSVSSSFRSDKAEQYAIALALQQKTMLLVEDQKARKIAVRHGLPIIGMAGLTIEAYRKNLISQREAKAFAGILFFHNDISEEIRQFMEDGVT